MREFLDVAAEMTAHGQTLDDLHMQIARGEKIVSFSASRQILSYPCKIGQCRRKIQRRSARQIRRICRQNGASKIRKEPEIP